ncbi:hypothetical protein CASFOL_039192 [Castilleja foliolosa]|uniref:Toprim domain-containing protein n=1 Tax=Castilleja foliolosa TaxID=1961234 RepID=A0ABD3BHB0_9LAMI
MQRKLLFPRSNSILKCSRNFLLLKSSSTPAAHSRVISLHSCSSCSCSSCSQKNNFNSSKNNLNLPPSTKHFPAIYQRAYAAMPIPRPIDSVDLETLENQFVHEKQLIILTRKLQAIGIHSESYLPGQYNALLCPSCKGGDSGEKSLSLNISPDGGKAVWTCFRAKCGWRGATRAKMNSVAKAKEPIRTFTQESLGLEPLCNELLAYFAERMISGETLRRNSVMQKKTGDQIAIAFTYRRKGDLVSCKYRTITKKFWQEANTEKIFYGLDDIKEGSDIIIVEGEMDKLAMEEAGFKNCVSVPDGAPAKVSNKALPSEEKDTKYQYLWNCKEYTEKASRIILATDADAPGQILAEELARRLGRERCWRVNWPNKNDNERFNDANEVLMYMGPDALRNVIETAELYPINGVTSTYEKMNSVTKVKEPIVTITEESLGLEPLRNDYLHIRLPDQSVFLPTDRNENLTDRPKFVLSAGSLLAYFAERMISKETLLRNNVMQVVGDRKIIAFPYRQNGQLVGCKYRTVEKRFWQVKNMKKVFYGLDDIAEADEIIIVEGEIDKLSVEEAGYYNCVSVPGGAPQTVSLKELPSIEKDTTFQYLWNCKDYFDKASRIIFATDADIPGQALAEELARRLGKERCWRVCWPKKDEVSYFKDANEVLVNLGAEALRDAIDKAELLYQMQKID